ncbi:MAG: DUF2189 domain-containing protein [Betaproteobacteria bacterium]|nr:MAG: DUF2189 domain-containing protein [Betaproteobacteria bacterium]
MTESTTPGHEDKRPEELPFAAPCKDLDTNAPIRWVKLGWQDLQRAPRISLTFGAMLVISSYLITYLTVTFGNPYVLVALLSGFIFLGPILAMAFYEISVQLQRGKTPTMAITLRGSLRHLGDQMVFAVILMIIFLVWARAASMIHVFFPTIGSPSLADLATFLTIGTIVGSLFATIVFCISAFSLPMIVDRKTDMVTAVVTSFNAVLRNKGAMVVWVAIIVAAVAAGMITGFIGFAITLPLIGHATWHAYQETIDASAWPQNPD